MFNGSNVGEKIDISADGGRARLFRDVGNVTMDFNDVEHVQLAELGGADKDAGIRGGWKPDLILLASRIVAERLAKRGRPMPRNFVYLEDAINDAHSPAAPTVAPTPAQPNLRLVTVTEGMSNGTGWKARRDAGHRAYERLRALRPRARGS